MPRGDPARVYQAQRAGIFRRLVTAERVDQLDAEHWISRWEREAELQGLDRHGRDFWAAGRDWIAEYRRRR